MSNTTRKPILSKISADEFVGRTHELDEILRHAKLENDNRGLLVLSTLGDGTTELLCQIYDQLFYENGKVIPIYFSLNSNHKTAEQVARNFLQTFLTQVVAFRRNDANLLLSAPDICEVAEKSLPSDGIWIDRLMTSCDTESRLEDELGFVRNCLSSPLRADAHGVKTLIMIDNLHLAEKLIDDISLIEELKEIFSRAKIPFVFAGKRRYLLQVSQSGNTKLNNCQVLHLQQLAFVDATTLIDNISRKYNVKINEQSSDLLIQQFYAKPLFIEAIFATARSKKKDLNSFQKVEQIYVDAVFGGRIGKIYDTILNDISPNPEIQRQIIGLLFDSLTSENHKSSIDVWQRRINLNNNEFQRLMKSLHTHELLRLTASIVEVTGENEILATYIKSRFRLEILAEPRVLAVADTLAESLKNAPKTMSNFYRFSSALGLRELLSNFNCQAVPSILFDYHNFKEKLKGKSADEMIEALKNEQLFKLPQMIFNADCVAFYPPIKQFSDDERCTVSLGFEQGNYIAENEIVWLVAEVDSKLEASKELAEFWCDRLEMVALMCDFAKYKLWLITPEGFSNEAIEVLNLRSAFGSSRTQIELLVKELNVENVIKPRLKANEYEMIVPMGDDTELIAANAVEEIAKRHHFQPKAINQMKTALVEACINASEHSHSPDGKIYQKFTVEDDRIIITISNRGVKMPAEKLTEITSEIEKSDGRRGWGLKLMKTLMDEVKFEQVDDGTSISMTKYLVKQ
jgi:serine/threonine-protein kinase RsbW